MFVLGRIMSPKPASRHSAVDQMTSMSQRSGMSELLLVSSASRHSAVSLVPQIKVGGVYEAYSLARQCWSTALCLEDGLGRCNPAQQHEHIVMTIHIIFIKKTGLVASNWADWYKEEELLWQIYQKRKHCSNKLIILIEKTNTGSNLSDRWK